MRGLADGMDFYRDEGNPDVTAKSIENVVANDNGLSGMQLNAAEMLDLSFLERLEEQRKTKAR